jgi:hypothetical protein
MAVSGNEQMADVELGRLRARVRADRRATSAPLLMFGVVTLAFAAGDNIWGRYVPAPLYWPLATAAALLGMWIYTRQRAVRHGVGEGRWSYAKLTGVFLVAVAVVISSWYMILRPLLWPMTALLVVALYQRNRVLAACSAGLVATAAPAWVYLVRSSDGTGANSALGLGYEWTETAVFAAAGAALLVMGVIFRVRERMAA